MKQLRKWVVIVGVFSLVMSLFPVEASAKSVSFKHRKSTVQVKKRMSSMVRLNWSKISGVKGYQVAIKRKGDDTYTTKLIKRANTLTTKLTLDAKKTAKVKVRGYKLNKKKKVYTKWSGVINVKKYNTSNTNVPTTSKTTTKKPAVNKTPKKPTVINTPAVTPNPNLPKISCTGKCTGASQHSDPSNPYKTSNTASTERYGLLYGHNGNGYMQYYDANGNEYELIYATAGYYLGCSHIPDYNDEETADRCLYIDDPRIPNVVQRSIKAMGESAVVFGSLYVTYASGPKTGQTIEIVKGINAIDKYNTTWTDPFTGETMYSWNSTEWSCKYLDWGPSIYDLGQWAGTEHDKMVHAYANAKDEYVRPGCRSISVEGNDVVPVTYDPLANIPTPTEFKDFSVIDTIWGDPVKMSPAKWYN